MPAYDRARELTRRFYEWERRGRGWERYPYPVALEPPFRFPDWHYRPSAPVDDTRREGLVSRIFRKQPAPARVVAAEQERLPEPFVWEGPPEERALLLPPEASVSLDASAAWLTGLQALSAPVAVELVGYGGEVEERIACAADDVRLLSASLQGVMPGAVLAPVARSLYALWEEGGSGETVAFYATLEFGLGREFMIPLAANGTARLDPLAPFAAVLADLSEEELGLLQILFTPARAPWPQAVHAAVVTPAGQPFFADAPEVTRLAQEKTTSPAFAAVLRTAALAGDPDRAFEIVRGLAGGLARFGSPHGNEFIPLASEDSEELLLDVLTRTTHRTGMLLSAHELALLAKLPGRREEAPAIRRLTPGKAAPARLTEDRSGLLLGENRVQGQARPVHLQAVDRLRHVHVVGASGTGKSTHLVRAILQDVEAGRGVGVLDPHGDLVDDVLARLPEERADEVIVFDPSDPESVVGWNLLSAEGEAERQMLASDLVAVFRRLSTSWGDQMTSVLANAVLAFLDSPRGGTLLDLRRFLVDKPFRDGFLRSVGDSHLRSFWATEFPLLVGRRPQGPILTRLDTLLRHRLVREVLTAHERPLDFRAVVSEGKVFLARLAQGAIGRENAALLGSLLLSTFHQVALARQDTPEAERRPFFLYLDEAHELATPSLAAMLSGTRKFGLGLVIAHQDLYQLRAAAPDVERSVLGNAHTRIVARSRARWGTPREALRETADTVGASSAVAVPPERPEAVPEPPTKRKAAPPAEPDAVGADDQNAPQVKGEVQPRPQEAHPEGRGGPEHRYLQSLIREWAHGQGFKVDLEHELPGGGRVDLVLSRGNGPGAVRIACEVSVSTGSAHESEHVRACLSAGFDRIFVVSLKRRFLTEVDKLLSEQLGSEERARVSAVTPEALLAWLSEEPALQETAPSTVAGYTVRTQARTPGAPEAEARRQRLAEVIGKRLRTGKHGKHHEAYRPHEDQQD